MTITCRKIGKTPLDFSFEGIEGNDKGAKIEGFLVYKGNALILLDAKLSGEVAQKCDVCCEPFQTPLDEKLELLVSDGAYTTETHVVEDVIEVQNGVISIDEVLHSELELIRSDYFVCETCEASNGEFEF